MQQLMLSDLVIATWQTIYMVFIASFSSIIIGLTLGVLLFLSNKHEHGVIKNFNRTLGIIVNITRSIPYIILMFLLIPITAFIIGTFIGTNAAIIPLAVAAIPFYARIAESAIAKVDKGLIEAANSMGATTFNIIFKVLLPEAKTQLINGATLTIISLIGYSAMAGAVGGGGLGALAYNFGYLRFDLLIMTETVIVLIILVQFCQSFGDYLAKSKSLLGLSVLTIILIVGSVGQIIYTNIPQSNNMITIGIVSSPEQQKIMKTAKIIAKQEYNLNLEIKPFDDYNTLNAAVNSGNLDVNIFQHIPFLESQIKQRGFKLTWVGKTFVYPMGIFSDKIKSFKNLPKNAIVAIPNDPTNEGRALMILADAKLITLTKGVSWKATLKDIIANPYNLQFKELDAAQIPKALKYVTLAAVTNDYVPLIHRTLKQALFVEPSNSPFGNIIVVSDKNKNNPIFKKLVKIMHSATIVKLTEKLYPDGAAIPAWNYKK